jgi:hypothetical protein
MYVTLQESRTACWSEPVPRKTTGSYLNFLSLLAKLFRPQKRFLQPLFMSEFKRKETVKPNQIEFYFLQTASDSYFKIWKSLKSKYLAA